MSVNTTHSGHLSLLCFFHSIRASSTNLSLIHSPAWTAQLGYRGRRGVRELTSRTLLKLFSDDFSVHCSDCICHIGLKYVQFSAVSRHGRSQLYVRTHKTYIVKCTNV